MSISKIFFILGVLGFVLTASFAPLFADSVSYIRVGQVHVRSEDSARSRSIAILKRGYKVSVQTITANGWAKILLTDGKIGYINAKLLTDTLPPTQKVDGTRFSVSVPQAFLRGEDRVHKEAVLKEGDLLSVVDDQLYQNLWIHVRIVTSSTPKYIGRSGYVAKSLVQKVDLVDNTSPVHLAPSSEPISLNSATVLPHNTGMPNDVHDTNEASGSVVYTGNTLSEQVDTGAMAGENHINEQFLKNLGL